MSMWAYRHEMCLPRFAVCMDVPLKLCSGTWDCAGVVCVCVYVLVLEHHGYMDL